MITNREDLNRVSQWMAHFARSVANPDPEDVDKITLYTGYFCRSGFPPSAFNADSLAYVVTQNEWWPPFAKLRRELAEWWDANRPARAPLIAYEGQGAVGKDGWDVYDHKWLEYYEKNVNGPAVPWCSDRRAHLASLLRQQSPKAWAFIRGPEPAEQPEPPPFAYDQQESF